MMEEEDDHRVDNTWAAFADTEEQTIHKKMEPVVGSRWDRN